MNKEFIPYEQALALKELGFDEPCLGAFHTASNRLITEFEVVNTPEHCVGISAPLYQQAFRWFREKHHKLVCIKNAIDRNRFIYLINDIVFGFYDTYEEAELACLKKIIEIVKNKS